MDTKPIVYGNPDINEIIEAFTRITGLRMTNITKQRRYAHLLLKRETKETIINGINFVASITGDRFAPRVSDIEKLYYKWSDLQLYGRKNSTARLDLATL